MRGRSFSKIDGSSNSFWQGLGFKAYRVSPSSVIVNDFHGTSVIFYGQTLENGTFLSNGAAVSPRALIGNECCILNVSIGDSVVIGDRSFVGTRSVIADSTSIGTDCSVGEDVKLFGGIYGDFVSLGDGYRGSNDVVVRQKVKIFPRCSCNGHLLIHENVIIGVDSALENGEIGSNSMIGEHVIGSDGFVIPAGTRIPDGFEIIGFREVKTKKSGYRLVPPP